MKYKEFVASAMMDYEALPQETNELYKRHYVHIPFDLDKYPDHRDGGKVIGSLNKENPYGMGVSFDAVMDSEEHILNNSGNVTIKDSSKLGSEFIKESARSSAEDKYAAYTNAHSERTLFVEVPKGMQAKVSLRFIATENPLNIHVVVNLGEEARLNLLELYESVPGNTVVGVTHEARLGHDSFAEINELHNENVGAVVLCFLKALLEENANLRFNAVYNGGSYVRARNKIEASRRGSSAEANELVFGSAEQKFDINTFIVNAAPETRTSLQSRAALMDTSQCMLKGFAKVAHGADRSNSYIYERGILLDKGAGMYSLPDMSVDENNVIATHSSATAPIDADEMFYLMSKGMDRENARRLIVNGFFAGCIEKIGNPAMREMTLSLMKEKLETKRFGRARASIQELNMRKARI